LFPRNGEEARRSAANVAKLAQLVRASESLELYYRAEGGEKFIAQGGY